MILKPVPNFLVLLIRILGITGLFKHLYVLELSVITFNMFIDIKISHNENILVEFFKNHFRVVKIQEVASLVTIYMQNGKFIP